MVELRGLDFETSRIELQPPRAAVLYHSLIQLRQLRG